MHEFESLQFCGYLSNCKYVKSFNQVWLLLDFVQNLKMFDCRLTVDYGEMLSGILSSYKSCSFI